MAIPVCVAKNTNIGGGNVEVSVQTRRAEAKQEVGAGTRITRARFVEFADAKDASGWVSDVRMGWDAAQKEGYNPKAYTVTRQKVTRKSKLKLRMAPCGGFAVSIREIK